MKSGIHLIIYRALTALCASAALLACTPSHSPALEEIYAAIESSPKDALHRASSISTDSLSPHDQQFLQLIKIKAADKIDIYQPNDTLITKLIRYYSDHETDRFYPEALYYGGRVYTELGDYPMALRHFQDALDLLPPDTRSLHLRGCTLSQIAYILNSLRLIDEALPYYQELLKVDSILNDTSNYLIDLDMMGYALYRVDSLEYAKKVLSKAVEMSGTLYPDNEFFSQSRLASILRKQGQIDSARSLIQPLINDTTNKYIDLALISAIPIFCDAGMSDSAYICGKRLIDSNSNHNKRLTYHYLLGDKLRDFSSVDSLLSYLNNYHNLTEKSFDDYRNQSAIIQNSYYNYAQHDRKRKKAEESRNKYAFIALSLGACVAVLTAVILWFMYRSKSQRLKYLEALDSIRMLSETIEKSHQYTEPKAANKSDNNNQPPSDKNAPDSGLNTLLAGPAYLKLCTMVKAEKAIAENSGLWNNLQSEFDAALPEFRHRLNQLAHSRISADDYKLIMLVRYGFNSAQISGIINKSKSTVSYRYSEIAKRIFNESFKFDKLRSLIKSI